MWLVPSRMAPTMFSGDRLEPRNLTRSCPLGRRTPRAYRHPGKLRRDELQSDPCSGFVTTDDEGLVCAEFRRCSSEKGVDGFPHPWDVPLSHGPVCPVQIH